MGRVVLDFLPERPDTRLDQVARFLKSATVALEFGHKLLGGNNLLTALGEIGQQAEFAVGERYRAPAMRHTMALSIDL
ncbi:hypothetical protein HC891_04710 [Candidatus Gracilibacteria bacterium]|nr:hypothetical protein [Candidatus Gracilibacteria bacterium]